jgi:hypothetical protein
MALFNENQHRDQIYKHIKLIKIQTIMCYFILFDQAINLVRCVSTIDDITGFLNFTKYIKQDKTYNFFISNIENKTFAKL